MKDLVSLRQAAGKNPTLLPGLIRLETIRELIEDECPDEVAWAAAYGKFVAALISDSTAPSKLPRDGVEILVVTTMKSIFQAHMLLGEKVFGPVLLEFGKLVSYHLWTLDEFRIARGEDHPYVNRALSEGINVYGSFESAIALSERHLSRNR